MKRIFAAITLSRAHTFAGFRPAVARGARPENYKLTFTPDLEKARFEGDETITIRLLKPTSEITLNAVDIDFHDVTVTSGGADAKSQSHAGKRERRWSC